MSNILLIDPKYQSSALLRVVLAYRDYGVSVSDNFHEAICKINTGLFDLICLDADNPGEKEKVFIQEAKKNIPDLPVIVISESDSAVIGEWAKIISRPIRLADFTAEVYAAFKSLEKTTAVVLKHREIELSVELENHKNIIPARVMTISLNGMLVRPDFNSPQPEQFQSFFAKKMDEINTVIRLKEEQVLRLVSRLTFSEKAPSERLKNVGLSFTKIGPAEQQVLETLITQAA